MAGLDKECDYAPREQKEGKNENGHGRNLEKKVECREPLLRKLIHQFGLTEDVSEAERGRGPT